MPEMVLNFSISHSNTEAYAKPASDSLVIKIPLSDHIRTSQSCESFFGSQLEFLLESVLNQYEDNIVDARKSCLTCTGLDAAKDPSVALETDNGTQGTPEPPDAPVVLVDADLASTSLSPEPAPDIKPKKPKKT